MISAPIVCASFRAILLLPTAVGPRMMTILGFMAFERTRFKHSMFNVQGKTGSIPQQLQLNPSLYLEPGTLNVLLAGPLEHPIQIIATKFKQHRPAMRTLGGKIDFVELVQQRAHLAHFQFSICPYHAVAGDGS